MIIQKCCAVLYCSLCLSFCSLAQTDLPRSYNVVQTSTPIDIDGKADEQWSQATWSESFIDIEGQKTPKYDTRMKMLWDDQYLYIYAEMEEPHVWGDITKRDEIIFFNNDFEVFIDPDGDTHNYMEFEINALNTGWDLFLTKPYRNRPKVIDNWDIRGIKSAVDIKGTLNNPTDIDTGWSVEIAMPWSALGEAGYNLKAPAGKTWRINFSRVNWDYELVDGKYSRKKVDGKYLPEYNWVWTPQIAIDMHRPEMWGYIYFSKSNDDTF
ncbi:carbohydrate-binding family 9-like protein [Fulvivirga ligni]|uniref:carbohydrate-binding family 9-like protein n=1 Tax=Fulvivirga ligni TaxID=2904246 RepID=UPI001F2EFE02|nr:carbohydrate-binding family 9-like protein [Fulvivirga ligni]UII19151.1 carbohydrate-binding family 9-like protein [Fulvivirga ligni]